MASKTHEYLVNAFDAVTDALASERNGHYLQVLALIADARIELDKAEELAVKIQEKNEIRASKGRA